MTLFSVAAGSVTGQAHRLVDRDGQDGHATVATGAVQAAIVTDGCSSGRTSEVGARIGAAWLAAIIARRFAPRMDDPREAADATCAELAERLELLARSMSAEGDLEATTIGEALLFGFLAAVVTREHAIVFGIGDGSVLANDEVLVIDPGPDNAPPYPAYALLGARVPARVHFVGRAADVRVLGVATDGLVPALHLRELAWTRKLSTNPSLLGKRLRVLAREHRFGDDATVAIVRRVEAEQAVR
ncbi:MAG: protein phosphatase 2C domain-containing protein [Deltaproteobacteria bacterium]|nr:protein phosphatase 2C domain-containing protein [Deltaproteobacteria bacterium]